MQAQQTRRFVGKWDWLARPVIVTAVVFALLGGTLMALADPTFKEQPVYRLVSVQQRPSMVVTAPGGAPVSVTTFVVTVVPLGSDRLVSYTMGTKDGSNPLGDCKRGDYITLTTQSTKSNDITQCAAYALQPGEDIPGVFVYIEAGDAVKAGSVLKLFKLGVAGNAIIPADKTALLTVASHLKSGDSIEAVGTPGNGGLVLSDLWIYVPPLTGTITAISQTTDNPITTALTLTAGDDTKTVLVPGKTDSKGVFKPDPGVLAAVKKLGINDNVMVQCHSDGQNLFIKSITLVSRGMHATTKPG